MCACVWVGNGDGGRDTIQMLPCSLSQSVQDSHHHTYSSFCQTPSNTVDMSQTTPLITDTMWKARDGALPPTIWPSLRMCPQPHTHPDSSLIHPVDVSQTTHHIPYIGHINATTIIPHSQATVAVSQTTNYNKVLWSSLIPSQTSHHLPSTVDVS